MALKTFQSVVGRLRNAATILPAARSLFTPINSALRGNPEQVPLGAANSKLCATLLDLRTMVLDLACRPTHVKELVARLPDYNGYCDASAFGAGGVWFSGESPLTPQVWLLEWPPDIQQTVISSTNPEGRLTNSNLEMAVLLHFNVLETCVHSLKHINTVIHSDNSPRVAWATTMATKTAKSEAAHRLLRGLAMRQRSLEAGPLQVLHIPGKSNNLADIASRPIPAIALDDSRFLTHFAALFPLSPKHTSWQRAHPMPAQLSNVILTLRGSNCSGNGGRFRATRQLDLVEPLLSRLRHRPMATRLPPRGSTTIALGLCRPD